MRVSGGIACGVPLKSCSSLRPTMDRVRGAIFSMLDALDWEKEKVLDLFAGTGALGIEALSRGAKWADFVEHNPRHCQLIKENLKAAGFSLQAHVYCLPVKSALTVLKGKYNLLFLDPPYNFNQLPELLLALDNSSLIFSGALVVVSHFKRLTLPSNCGNLKLIRERNYGDTVISIYRRGVDPSNLSGDF